MPKSAITNYAENLASTFNVRPTRVLAKILTQNDDAGRHGVLIPNEAYGFFPELPIPDPSQNSTVLIAGLDVISGIEKPLGWKYYERYPERRITRINGKANLSDSGRRLVIFTKAIRPDSTEVILADVRLEDQSADFPTLLAELFDGAPTNPGAFVQMPLGAVVFQKDGNLSDLLRRYDHISSLGWIDTRRSGDTGIGYTFESLMGIRENNDQNADFNGIEIKCSLKKAQRLNSTKINLFQSGPSWATRSRMIDRLKKIGTLGDEGLYSCYSQVTPTENNLGLKLSLQPPYSRIDIHKANESLGFWTREALAKRLAMKHSRAVFVKAESRVHKGTTQYQYNELVYCEKPEMERFIDLVTKRRIVFEFAMHEKTPGKVRNHGYPWRLADSRELDTLFGFQIRLRG